MALSDRQRGDVPARVAAIAAGMCFVAALAGFGAALQGYAHSEYPVALLGADGVPRATWFNVLAFLLPGLLAACVALRARAGLLPAAPLAARLGWNLALLAALAFAMQGLLPLDASAPDAGIGRLHGTAWGLWGIAFAAAAAMLALSALGHGRPAVAVCHLGAGALVFALAWLAGEAVPAAVAQRVALAGWFAWLAWAGLTQVPAVR